MPSPVSLCSVRGRYDNLRSVFWGLDTSRSTNPSNGSENLKFSAKIVVQNSLLVKLQRVWASFWIIMVEEILGKNDARLRKPDFDGIML